MLVPEAESAWELNLQTFFRLWPRRAQIREQNKGSLQNESSHKRTCLEPPNFQESLNIGRILRGFSKDPFLQLIDNGRLTLKHLQCWEVLPFLAVHCQQHIKIYLPYGS